MSGSRKVLTLLAVCAWILLPSAAHGAPQEETVLTTPTAFQYAVKFVCGKTESTILARGLYLTAINVHNPAMKTIEFRKKFAIALPNQKPGKVSQWFPAKLGPDEAFDVECQEIFKRSGTSGFATGFAVFESRYELDVVAVYTAAGGTSGDVATMDVETVPPRRIVTGPEPTGQPDLIPVPDATGNFCKREGSKLIVTVRNQGTGAAGPSTTRVDFTGFPTQTRPTPALAPGAQTDVTFDIPPGCFNPDCDFRITVDSAAAVPESNEGNNTASGVCLG